MKNKTILFLIISVFFLISFFLAPVLALGPEIKQIPEQAAKNLPQNQAVQIRLPQGNFIDLSQDEQISQNKILKFQIQEARSVEFYAREVNSLTSVYLGRAAGIDNVWEYNWNTKSLPDSSYFIYPRIDSQYGEYSGPEISVRILNKEEPVFERTIEQAEEKIKEKEKKVEEKKEQTKVKAEESLEELKKSAIETARPEAVEEVRKKIEEIKKEIPEEIKKAVDLPEVEKRKEVKTEVTKKMDELKRETEQLMNEDKMEEFKGLTEDVGRRLDSVFDQVENIVEEKQAIEIERDRGLWFVHKDPRRVEPFNQESLIVEKIEVIEDGQLMISGIGTPNTYVTIHIFSSPIVLAANVDDLGRWGVVLDKGVVDGKHTVYAASIDEKGDLLAMSDTFVFAKSGANVFRILDVAEEIKHPLREIQKNFLILVISLIVFGLSIAFLIIGMTLLKKAEKEKVS